MAKCFAARKWSDLTKNYVFQFALADESRVPTNEELESILKFRSEGHFSDKNSDFLDPLRQKRPRLRTLRASEARRQAELQSEEEEEEEEGVRVPVICNNLERALFLSLRYQFVTPLTSLVVIKPDTIEKVSFLNFKIFQ